MTDLPNFYFEFLSSFWNTITFVLFSSLSNHFFALMPSVCSYQFVTPLPKTAVPIIKMTAYVSSSMNCRRSVIRIMIEAPMINIALGNWTLCFSFRMNNVFSSLIQFAIADLNLSSSRGDDEITVNSIGCL